MSTDFEQGATGALPEHGPVRPAPQTPVCRVPEDPYATSAEHLRDALGRIDMLVRAQTVRWWKTIAADKPDQLWGMIHVTDAEIVRYFNAPFDLPPDLPADLAHVLDDYWQQAAALDTAIAVRLAATPEPLLRSLRLQQLCAQFGLTDFERDIVLVCLLPDLDARYRRLFAYLQDDASRTRPPVELVLQILHPVMPSPEAGRAAFAAGAPLSAARLLAVGGEGRDEDALPMRPLRLDSRIVRYLLSSDTFDERLTGSMTRTGAVDWNDLTVEAAQLARLQALAAWWAGRCALPDAGATLLLHGPYGSGRRTAAQAFCTATATPLLVVDLERALQAAGGWQTVVDLAYREARLQNAALYWAGCDLLLAVEQQRPAWDYLLAAAEGFAGLTFLAGQTSWDPVGRFRTPGRPFLRLAFAMPDYTLRQRLWHKHLPAPAAFAPPPPDSAALATMLANSFQLTEGQIVDALANAYGQALARDPQQPRLTLDDLYEGCRRQTGQRLVTMARLIEPRTETSFDELILPPANKRQLDELRDRITYRNQLYSGLGFERRLSLGKGLIALFTGSSGTGKTMAAELLAREQGVDLYKIDLSAVVSKYVGETEKNLNRVFADAEDANAILFFDEADSLFGKRGEVKEARDKWANMETNFLLQRVEEYTGVVILASNLRQNFDEAFMRRIHVIVEFPFPETAARARIWRGMFPAGIQRPPDEEIAALAAQFRLTGGSIKNIVVDAAFRALAESGGVAPQITMRHLIAGAVREYQKLGKPVTKGEFSPQFYVWVEEDGLLA